MNQIFVYKDSLNIDDKIVLFINFIIFYISSRYDSKDIKGEDYRYIYKL